MILSLVVICSGSAFAQAEKEQLVEVHIRQDTLAPYKERRPTHGTYFSLSYEALELSNFQSMIDGVDYKTAFGASTIPLLFLEIEYKYNFALGGLAFGLNLGQGSVSSSISGDDRSIELRRMGVGAKYILDNIFSEPYVAPYAGINMWQMSYKETTTADSFSTTISSGLSYTVGIMLQLNWIDKATSQQATFDYGIENTYIDLHASQYASTEAQEKPNLETDWILGAGLRLEF
jgi:hypothetical protein